MAGWGPARLRPKTLDGDSTADAVWTVISRLTGDRGPTEGSLGTALEW